MVGVVQGAGRGAAVRAVNKIEADGAASLAPSLLRMTQLTSLNFESAWIGGQQRCERVVANTGNVLMILRDAGWGGCAQGCSGWWGYARGEPRGGGACRQSDRR